jgi:Flp pilus assembly protein TadD
VRANQGLILGERGDRAAAIAVFREALAIDPRHARSHYGLGAMLADEGRLEEAATELSTATRLDPSLTVAREELDRVLTALGRRR